MQLFTILMNEFVYFHHFFFYSSVSIEFGCAISPGRLNRIATCYSCFVMLLLLWFRRNFWLLFCGGAGAILIGFVRCFVFALRVVRVLVVFAGDNFTGDDSDIIGGGGGDDVFESNSDIASWIACSSCELSFRLLIVRWKKKRATKKRKQLVTAQRTEYKLNYKIHTFQEEKKYILQKSEKNRTNYKYILFLISQD